MKSLVSVITPYRNAKRFLPGFVDSLRSQTAQDWCCIMVDDNSSDGGPELLRDLVADDPRFLLISNTNPKHGPGPASARPGPGPGLDPGPAWAHAGLTPKPLKIMRSLKLSEPES